MSTIFYILSLSYLFCIMLIVLFLSSQSKVTLKTDKTSVISLLVHSKVILSHRNFPWFLLSLLEQKLD